MDGATKYPWASAVNVANFVTVKPCVEGSEGRSNFKIWKKQMLCLLQSQDLVGFVDGEFLPPENNNTNNDEEEQKKKVWRRTDGLVQGWILGSIGKDALDVVWDKPTAREIWLELENIFKQRKRKILTRAVRRINSPISISEYSELYQAAQRGDWGAAKGFFKNENDLSTTIISSDYETALHVAVAVSTGKANDFVKKLVQLTPSEALGVTDHFGDTALHKAAAVGNIDAAAALVNKNSSLLYKLNNKHRIPVQEAAENLQKDTLRYLILKHDDEDPKHSPFKGQMGIRLLIAIIASGYPDIALHLVQKFPDLAVLTESSYGRSALSTIAETEDLFPRTETFNWWQNFIYHRIPLEISRLEAPDDIENMRSCSQSCIYYSQNPYQIFGRVGKKVESMIWCVIQNLVPKVKELREKKETHRPAQQLVKYLCNEIVCLPENEASSIFQTSMIKAAEHGISDVVETIIHKYPAVTLHQDDNGRNLFLLAASYRLENVVNIIKYMGRKYISLDSKDNDDNNLMHICGKLAPPHRLNLVAGAPLQMQRELQWFKEMERFVHPSHRTMPNSAKQTPQELFRREHKQLKEDGERWMKDTATACNIAATLIATVVFAAAFTVPGGVESTTGIPVFSGEPAFVLFAVSDAVSLFTSITSVLMFISILTSRYSEEDFLHVLPKRLSIGLLSLFVSVISMTVAFSAGLYLVLQRDVDVAWFLVLVAVFATLPVTSFVLSQYPILADVIYSTYGPGIFAKKSGRFVY